MNAVFLFNKQISRIELSVHFKDKERQQKDSGERNERNAEVQCKHKVGLAPYDGSRSDQALYNDKK